MNLLALEIKNVDNFKNHEYSSYKYSDIAFFRNVLNPILEKKVSRYTVYREEHLTVATEGGLIVIKRGWDLEEVLSKLEVNNYAIRQLLGYMPYSEDLLYKTEDNGTVKVYIPSTKKQLYFISIPYRGHIVDAVLKGMKPKINYTTFKWSLSDSLEFYNEYARLDKYVPFNGDIKDLVEASFGAKLEYNNHIYKCGRYTIGYNLYIWIYSSLPKSSYDFVITHYDLFKDGISEWGLPRNAVAEVLSNKEKLNKNLVEYAIESAIYYLNK